MSSVLMFGGSAQTMRRARDLGVEPLLLQRPADRDESLRSLVGRYGVVPFDDTDAVLDIAARWMPFDRALSVTEVGMLPAAHVNERFGLGGTPSASVRLLTDKWRMRVLLNDIGLSPVAATLAAGPADIVEFIGRHGLPVIVKPAALSASIGVSRVDSLADVTGAWARVRALGLDRVLVEEYLAGPEISVESISFGRGRHHVVAVTAKSTLDNFVEVGHVVPARLPTTETAEIHELTVALLNAVGHTDGPAHTEMRLTAAGPRIIESHNRQGGDHITDLVDIVYGVDLIKTSIAWATGRTNAWATAPTGRGAAAVRFLTPPPGHADAITGVDDVRAWDGVVAVNLAVSPGDEIREIHSSHERAGCVIVQAPDTAAATHLATRAAAGIRFAAAEVLRG
ncbi:hypothetical protein GCM10029964_048790 [Kibdelosporangium lantanae]